MTQVLTIEKFGDRLICIKGVGKMFYQEGFPLSISVSKLKKNGIELSILHVVEELWDNGWSWQTIERKLKGEIDEDIDKVLDIDFDLLHNFYRNLEQPNRSNGGYEKSREMIFRYLFDIPSDDAIKEGNRFPFDWLVDKINEHNVNSL